MIVGFILYVPGIGDAEATDSCHSLPVGPPQFSGRDR